jgi:hypothetical protein
VSKEQNSTDPWRMGPHDSILGSMRTVPASQRMSPSSPLDEEIGAQAYGRGIQFRVLGPLEVDAGGGPVPLGGPKQRAVLAHLLFRANQLVPAETLVDEIWGEEPPEQARNIIQT